MGNNLVQKRLHTKVRKLFQILIITKQQIDNIIKIRIVIFDNSFFILKAYLFKLVGIDM